MKRLFLGFVLVLAAGFDETMAATPDTDRIPPATQSLLEAFPGTRIFMTGNDIRVLYGVPMTAATTPDQAAAWWLQDYAEAFGVPNLDLRLERFNQINPAEKFTVFVYRQYLDNLPVESGTVRLLVLNGSPNQVVYASARLARTPEDGFQQDTVSAAAAMSSVKEMQEYSHLTKWTAAELVILFGPALGETESAARTWKFQGTYPDPANFESYTFFVDVSDGKLLHVRNEVHYTDIEGSTAGKGSPGLLPDVGYNLPVVMTMEDVRVLIDGGATVYSDANGNFVLPNAGVDPVTVEADPIGRWVAVNNDQGAEIHVQQLVTPPGPANLTFNLFPTQFNTSQVNAHIHTTGTHDFYKDRQPGFLLLDTPIDANVNLASSCNAYFSSAGSINFYNAAGGCPNTAYSTVIAHEYGHFIVDRHFLSQGSFGEGYADCVSILQFDDPVVGQDFFGAGTYVRDTVEANQQYPCFEEIHTCGQVLSGVWWDLKLNLEDDLGEAEALAFTQQLFTDWTEMTHGGDGNDAAHPETAIEVLEADDVDGNIDNGTPNRADICDAFAKHNIDCPDLNAIAFLYPDGLPSLLTPNQSTTIRVTVYAVVDTPVPSTGTITYRLDNGTYITVPMTELSPNEYEATLPAASCPVDFDYYFSAEALVAGTVTDPKDAPATTFNAAAAYGTATVLALNFETDPGWTVSGDADTGHWERGVPITGGDRGDAPFDYDGSGQCYVTENMDSDFDVDGGTTTLTSTSYDLTQELNPHVSYARWYSNTFGAAPKADVFVVDVSDNGGASWVNLETVGPGGPEVDGDWYVKTFRIADYVDVTDQFAIRFSASDLGDGSVVEAGIDAFEIFGHVCDAPACEGDANGDGIVDPLDNGHVLARFGCPVGTGDAECDAADQNADGIVDPLDSGYVLSRLGECP